MQQIRLIIFSADESISHLSFKYIQNAKIHRKLDGLDVILMFVC